MGIVIESFFFVIYIKQALCYFQQTNTIKSHFIFHNMYICIKISLKMKHIFKT